MDEITRLFSGAKYDQKLEEFEKKLAEIGEKHSDYFKGRKNKAGDPDAIDKHWRIIKDSYGGGLILVKGSDLPKHIQDECFAMHASIFGEK